MTDTHRIPTSTSNGTTVSSQRSRLLTGLDAEWSRLRTSRRAVHAARRWAVEFPAYPFGIVVAELTDLGQLLDATQRDPSRADDTIMLALVELARYDELAGRVVLQRLLPALIARSKCYRSYHDRSDPFEIVIPAAWLAIRSYDAAHRRRHVAASLVSDSIFQAFRRPLRRRSATESTRAPDAFSSTPCIDDPASPLDEFIAMTRDAQRAGVPTHDIELLRHLVRAGSPGVVAKERNVTPRTVRNHRDRAVEHVRAALAVAA